MIVFKYFFQVLKQYRIMIILYTAILIIFGAFSLKTNNPADNFNAVKPNVCIVNEDEKVGLTQSLYHYLEENTNIKEIKNTEEARSDALFYRDISYIIYIPKNFTIDFMSGKKPNIQIKSAGDYGASLAQMLLDNYLKTATIYLETKTDNMIEKIEKALKQDVKIEMTSNINNEALDQVAFYYNFANYSILAITIFIIATIMSSFKEEKIKKRTLISSMKTHDFNRFLFCGIMVLGFALWITYYLISVILIKDAMFSIHGILYAINSLLFTICALAIAFLIGNVVNNKEAINGIANVLSLGSSFLCGAFVPVQMLPDFVLTIAHIFPSYWYIQSNEYIKTLENINLQTLTPLIINSLIIVAFILVFTIFTNLYTKKRK